MDNSKNRFRTHIALAGSQRIPIDGQIVGQPEPNDRFEVTLLLRRTKNLDQEASRKGLFISLAELEEAYGATDADLDLVRHFAEHFSLDIVEVDMGKRLVDRDDDTIVERHSTVLSRYISFHLTDLSQYRRR